MAKTLFTRVPFKVALKAIRTNPEEVGMRLAGQKEIAHWRKSPTGGHGWVEIYGSGRCPQFTSRERASDEWEVLAL